MQQQNTMVIRDTTSLVSKLFTKSGVSNRDGVYD